MWLTMEMLLVRAYRLAFSRFPLKSDAGSRRWRGWRRKVLESGSDAAIFSIWSRCSAITSTSTGCDRYFGWMIGASMGFALRMCTVP